MLLMPQETPVTVATGHKLVPTRKTCLHTGIFCSPHDMRYLTRCVNTSCGIIHQGQTSQGPDSMWRCRITNLGNPIGEIRRWRRLIPTMGLPILIRNLYIESRPEQFKFCEHLSNMLLGSEVHVCHVSSTVFYVWISTRHWVNSQMQIICWAL